MVLIGVFAISIFIITFLIRLDKASFSAIPVICFILSSQLYVLFPIEFEVMGSINLIFSCIASLWFGKCEDRSLMGAAFFNGGMAGVMGTMVGAVAVNPALCGLPPSILSFTNTRFAVGFFSFFLLGITSLLIRLSTCEKTVL